MAAGTLQTIVVCVEATHRQAPCPSGMALTTIQGYVIDPTQATNIDAQNAPFDYSYASGIWALGFAFVVGLYLVSKASGVILNRIRR